jgi:hypothetical protein
MHVKHDGTLYKTQREAADALSKKLKISVNRALWRIAHGKLGTKVKAASLSPTLVQRRPAPKKVTK